jgi:hypothetical protein
MSSSSSPTLVLELQRQWLRLLPAALLGVMAVVIPLLITANSIGLHLVYASMALALVVAAVLHSGIGRPGAQIASVSWGADHHWCLRFKTGAQTNANLSARSWLLPWIMCLKFTTDTQGTHQIMLWRGELTRSAWQQWQLRLRLEAGQVTQDRVPESAP